MTTNPAYKIFTPGRVILAGAGPGDPGLVTLKLAQTLAIADVIIADRLVNPQIIQEHAKPEAEIITVGKQGYNDASTRQEDINHLLVDKSNPGKTVVRLKGGDVAIFSNVWDEISALREAGIPYEIIPGITAASGASAYAGIPLTARAIASGVRFVTISDTTPLEENIWADWASTMDTLVFYMCVAKTAQIIERLRPMASEDKPMLCIEQATTPFQRISCGRLNLPSTAWLPQAVSTPALLIIGEVCSLHQAYQWFKSVELKGTVFTEITTSLT